MSDRDFIDLEVLLNKVKDKEIKQYTEEAINCYYAKAYRSAILAIWVAIVLDLYKKIRVIANEFDDPAAALSLSKISGARSNDQAHKWEKEVLKDAYESIHVISKEQYERLSRIENDRHKCAHPVLDEEDILYQPTSEETRAHIRNAIEILLSQQAIFGKNFACKILEKLDSEYIGIDRKSIKVQIIDKYIFNANDIFKKNLIKLLFNTLLRSNIEDNSKMFKYARTLILTCECSSVIVEKIKSDLIKIIDSTIDDSLWILVSLLEAMPLIYELSPESIKNKLSQYALANSFDDKLILAFYDDAMWEPIKAEYFDQDVEEQKRLFVQVEKLNGYDNSLFVDFLSNIMLEFVTSPDFNTADDRANGILNAVDFFKKEQIELLLNEAPDNNIGGNYGGINQLFTNPDVFVIIYKRTKDKYPELQPNWETFIETKLGKHENFEHLQKLVKGEEILQEHIEHDLI